MLEAANPTWPSVVSTLRLAKSPQIVLRLPKEVFRTARFAYVSIGNSFESITPYCSLLIRTLITSGAGLPFIHGASCP